MDICVCHFDQKYAFFICKSCNVKIMVRWVETSVARFFEILADIVAFKSSIFGFLPNYTFFARNRNVFVIFVQKVSQVFGGTGFQPHKVPKVGADS